MSADRLNGYTSNDRRREEILWVRKGKLVTQLIYRASVNANNEFLNIVARWSGPTYESRIFDSKGRLQNGEIDGILVGNSGFPCKTYLMTPLLKPRSVAERRSNRAQKRKKNKNWDFQLAFRDQCAANCKMLSL